MGTPIYDDLMGRVRSADPPGSGDQTASSCAWCGSPVWAGGSAVEFEVDDSETGEPVSLTACTEGHRDALVAHRARDDEARS